jgi:hypothetical protein
VALEQARVAQNIDKERPITEFPFWLNRLHDIDYKSIIAKKE